MSASSDPTLEQIAERKGQSNTYCSYDIAILARELLALRGRIERCDEWSVQHGQMIHGQDKRLDELERVRRDGVMDGTSNFVYTGNERPNVGASSLGWPDASAGAPESPASRSGERSLSAVVPDAHTRDESLDAGIDASLVAQYMARAEKAERERDGWREQFDLVSHERDEACAEAAASLRTWQVCAEDRKRAERERDKAERGHREVCDINVRLIVAHNRERDAFRAALAKHGRHGTRCPRSIYNDDRPCTCGLADALANTIPLAPSEAQGGRA